MWPTYSDNVSHKVSISIYILTAKILKKHTSSVTTEESGNKTQDYLRNMLPQLATSKFVAWQVESEGGNTGDNALQLPMQ